MLGSSQPSRLASIRAIASTAAAVSSASSSKSPARSLIRLRASSRRTRALDRAARSLRVPRQQIVSGDEPGNAPSTLDQLSVAQQSHRQSLPRSDTARSPDTAGSSPSRPAPDSPRLNASASFSSPRTRCSTGFGERPRKQHYNQVARTFETVAPPNPSARSWLRQLAAQPCQLHRQIDSKQFRPPTRSGEGPCSDCP